jgi:hypothetical protein
LDLRGRKCEEGAERYIMRSFVIPTLHKILLLFLSNQKRMRYCESLSYVMMNYSCQLRSSQDTYVGTVDNRELKE